MCGTLPLGPYCSQSSWLWVWRVGTSVSVPFPSLVLPLKILFVPFLNFIISTGDEAQGLASAIPVLSHHQYVFDF